MSRGATFRATQGISAAQPAASRVRAGRRIRSWCGRRLPWSAYLEQAGARLEHRPAERRLASTAKGSGNGRLRMSREEALDILGLEPSASAQEIADAHRRLGERIDPHAGGTHYLSMKIDEARDVLLGD